MKYLELIVVLLIITVCRTAYAESYVVDTPVLNVRSCAGTNCKIIGKLTEGNTVNSIQEHGEWVEIETENGSGYVIKKALADDASILSVISVFILIILGLWFLFFMYFLPSRVAADNKNANKIYHVNLFLGWIPIIWLILLLAALIGESKED